MKFSKLRVAALATLAMLLAAGCGGARDVGLQIEIVDFLHLAPLGDLRVRVCSRTQLDLSQLRVNVYVTESDAWRESAENPPYTDFIRQPHVGIPGAPSAPIARELWHAADNGCYEAVLTDALVDAQYWIDGGTCPFNALVAVADYRVGAWNAAGITECALPE